MAVMLALLTLLAPLAVAGDHPAVKIIAMVQKLQQQVKEEGAEDTHVYGKFTSALSSGWWGPSIPVSSGMQAGRPNFRGLVLGCIEPDFCK